MIIDFFVVFLWWKCWGYDFLLPQPFHRPASSAVVSHPNVACETTRPIYRVELISTSEDGRILFQTDWVRLSPRQQTPKL